MIRENKNTNKVNSIFYTQKQKMTTQLKAKEKQRDLDREKVQTKNKFLKPNYPENTINCYYMSMRIYKCVSVCVCLRVSIYMCVCVSVCISVLVV